MMLGAIRTGDRVAFRLPIFSGGSFFRGRSTGKPKLIGHREYSGVVKKHSYGSEKGQHTFTILLDEHCCYTESEKKRRIKLVKGRNLYPNLLLHEPDVNSPDRVHPIHG